MTARRQIPDHVSAMLAALWFAMVDAAVIYSIACGYRQRGPEANESRDAKAVSPARATASSAWMRLVKGLLAQARDEALATRGEVGAEVLERVRAKGRAA